MGVSNYLALAYCRANPGACATAAGSTAEAVKQIIAVWQIIAVCMAKGGKQNIQNEITRDLLVNRDPDPCKKLRDMKTNTSDTDKLRKIKEAEKYFDCDNRGRFK
jgi:hypothetical protein